MGKRSLFLISTAILTALGMLGLFMAALDSQSAAAYNGEPPAFWIYEKAEYVPGRLLVKFRNNLSVNLQGGILRTGDSQVDNLLSGEGVVEIRPLIPAGATRLVSQEAGLSRIYRLDLGDEGDVFEAISQFQNNPEVEWAEPDYIARSAEQAASPNDPLLPGQWGLTKIEAQQAWDVVTGTQVVVIAILDSGIDKTHVDLSSQLWVNPGEIPGNSLDDDNNGFVDDINGWDFVNEDNDPSDDNGHGTQVAGIAAAATDNALGIAGMCWNCKIMTVKVMQGSGIANYSAIAAGVLYAAQKGAEVINLSLGGYSNSSALSSAIQAAVNTYGAVVVGGAGNDNLNAAFFPAAYEEVLAVAGTTDVDEKASLSNYGIWVDVSAPAINVTTTFLGGDWGPANGTSFAAPFVSGLAGLLRSQHPEWTPEMVKTHVEHTTDAIDALNPAYAGMLGSGRINAAQAVSINPQPILSLEESKVNGDPLGRPTQGESSSLSITLSNDWLEAQGTTATLTTADPLVTIGQETASFGDIPAGGISTSTPVYTFEVALAAGYNHPIPFLLQVSANSGTYTINLPLTITTRSANEAVGGTISLDTLWTNDKTYLVNSNVGVAPGKTLTIQAGTVVKFNGNYNLNVGGTLIADGTDTQPIRFMSNSSSNWGRIYFDDPGVDATTDINGSYQAGNIIRWVQIEKASQGIACNSATPYISHITLDGGGVNCTLGATTLWLQDNNLAGNVSISGAGQVLRNTITNGGLSLTGQATVRENHVNGGISTGSDSQVMENTVTGTINAPGASTVEKNTITSGGVTGGNFAQVESNQITKGSITVGSSSSVLTNTLTGGGIAIGNGSTASNNNIEGAPGWGISTSGSVTLSSNRVVGGANGVALSGGSMQSNLIANNNGIGLQINGNSTVINNTFTGNLGTTIKLISATNLILNENNLEGNLGAYDIENLIPTSSYPSIPALNNWWGTTFPGTIELRIFDYSDEYTLGQISFTPMAVEPILPAPAYVRMVTTYPPSPVGIENVTFDLFFSRMMEYSILPDVTFNCVNKGKIITYNVLNSGLPSNEVYSMASKPDGSVWIATLDGVAHFNGVSWKVYYLYGSPGPATFAVANTVDGSTWFGTVRGAVHFDGINWTYYDGLAGGWIRAISIAADGSIWFGGDYGLVNFDGANWRSYGKTNVSSIANNPDGSVWIGTYGGGASHFDGSTWTVKNTTNSDLPNNVVLAVAGPIDGSTWFGTAEGAANYDGTNWTVYNSYNSGLIDDIVYSILSQSNETFWFGTGGGAVRFDGSEWTVPPGSGGFPSGVVQTLAGDVNGSIWFGTSSGGAAKLWNCPTYPVNVNAQWLDSKHFRASYDINTLVPRDIYAITVKGAAGLDGIRIAANTVYAFTVDYAVAIGDTTPPFPPLVQACSAPSLDTLSASWSAHDPDSAITLYRYAIGTFHGGIDVVNWTNTSSTTFLRSGLSLVSGQTYFVSVKARNEGGLWSAAGTPAGVIPGSNTCTSTNNSIFLPFIRK